MEKIFIYTTENGVDVYYDIKDFEGERLYVLYYLVDDNFIRYKEFTNNDLKIILSLFTQFLINKGVPQSL